MTSCNLPESSNDHLLKFADTGKISDSFEISLPLFDSLGDQITIYVEKSGEDQFIISDDRYIMNNYLDSGSALTDPRKELLQTAFRQNGLDFDIENGELITKSTKAGLILTVYSFGQALLTVNESDPTNPPHTK